MGPLVWLVSKTTYLLVKTGARMVSEVTDCVLRLFYWSVRAYGWGRVAGVILSLAGSLWLNAQMGWLSMSIQSVAGVLAGAITVWSVAAAGAFWFAHQRRNFTWTDPTETATAVARNAPIEVIPPITQLNQEQGTELWDRLQDTANLQRAWQKVLLRGGAPGTDRVTVEGFALNPDHNLAQLEQQLRSGRYRPHPPRWVEIPKPAGGTRRLGMLCVQDRIIQQAMLAVLMPLWDRKLSARSYAYRPGRSAQQAVAAVEQALKDGRTWVVDADIASFFDSVPHAPLFNLLNEWLPDARLRSLTQMCISTIAPEARRGLAQGAPLSPLLANVYLHRFDEALSQAGYHLIRYADDFVILCATQQQAEQAMLFAQRLLHGLDLRLNVQKTRILHCRTGFTFLGWKFGPHGKRPSEQAETSLRMRLSSVSDEAKRRQILSGWQGYFGEAVQEHSTATDESDVHAANHLEESSELPWWADMQPDMAGQAGEASANTINHDRSDVDLAKYRMLFEGRPDVFARCWQKESRCGYMPVRHELTDGELRQHLDGETVIGTYPLLDDGLTRLLVMDIDGPDFSEAGRSAAFRVARDLAEAFGNQEIPPIWVDSGGKGFHLWFCLDQPISAKDVRQWANRWLDRFRPFPAGVVVELFPKQDCLSPQALGALIRMPLGRHPQTQRKSILLGPGGQPVENPWLALATVEPLESQALLASSPQEVGGLGDAPQTVALLIDGCNQLAALVKKARQTGDLGHTERLALLYTLGHLGEAGTNYLHQVMALCPNYDPRVTDRWIKRMEQGHSSIRCAKLKEWLKDYVPGITCPCKAMTRKANATPLDLLRKTRRAQTANAPTALHRPVDAWNDVAQEMFGEALAQPDARMIEDEQMQSEEA